jgi:hypothetical protein
MMLFVTILKEEERLSRNRLKEQITNSPATKEKSFILLKTGHSYS